MKYTVKSGDTLSKIAKEVYGDANRWREIVEANKELLKNPNLIRPGWELVIPGVGEAEAAPPPPPPVAPPDVAAAAPKPAKDEAEKGGKGTHVGDTKHELT